TFLSTDICSSWLKEKIEKEQKLEDKNRQFKNEWERPCLSTTETGKPL
ncbi:hypothetical protein TNIN_391601, partial [Trichonephila inaurata madagascariensis]